MSTLKYLLHVSIYAHLFQSYVTLKQLVTISQSALRLQSALLDVKLRDRILLSPFTKLLLPSIIISMVLPVTVYALMISRFVTDSSYSTTTCNLRSEYRVDCLPGVENVTETECENLLCCWNETINLCYHTVPSKHGYSPVGGVYYEGVSLSPRETYSPLGSANVADIELEITAVDSNHVEITVSTFSVSGSRKRRASRSRVEDLEEEEEEEEEDEITRKLLYFLPRDRNRRTVEIQLDSTNLNAYVHYPEFSVTVARDDFTLDESSSIFSTARGPLIMTETYWEWTMFMNNGTLFGLNDLETNGTTNWVYNNENGSVTPAFLAINQAGVAAAYYLDYKGPLEVEVKNVSNLVILRGLGLPDSLSVHIFGGPTPLEAVEQLTLALSSSSSINPPGIRPLYNYGIHVCPNGNFYSVSQSIVEMNETVEFMAAVEAPWDSHCIHERLAPVINHELTQDDLAELSAIREILETDGRTFSPHLSPMVIADNGTLQIELENGILLMTNGSSPYLGEYQDFVVVYPDWTSTAVETVSQTYLESYLNDTGYPGTIWLRDAWPKDSTNSSIRSDVDFSVFDYVPEELEFAMDTMTIPFDLETASGESHHKTHNAYSEGFKTFVRSSTPTIEFQGPPAEAANTSWSALRRSVRSAVAAGIVGQLPSPIYVCGTSDFDTDIHDELCIRWYQAAVALPYVTVLPDRLPGGSNLSTTASLTISKALQFRASLATYQHTAVARHFKNGSPLLAPTSLYYPEDGFFFTWDQFMWGQAILVGLVTLPGVSQVPMRLPGDNSWRHLMGGYEAATVTNGTTPITATLGEIVTLVRPGYIVPIHMDVGNTTVDTISRNVTLMVNMNCENDTNCSASGEIYYGLEIGEFLEITINTTHLTFSNVTGVQNYACNVNSTVVQSTFIQSVEILGNSTHQINTDLCDLGENILAVSLV